MQQIRASLFIDGFYKDFSLEMLALVAENGKTYSKLQALITSKSAFNTMLYMLCFKTNNMIFGTFKNFFLIQQTCSDEI